MGTSYPIGEKSFFQVVITLGIRQAKGDFIFLLNNDTYLPDEYS